MTPLTRFTVVSVSAWVLCSTGPAPQETRRPSLSSTMHRKLVLTQELLGSLSRKDFPRTSQLARSLEEMCDDETWQIIQQPEFAARSTTFRKTAASIDSMAQRHRMDGAALSFLQLTTQCFECHKYVESTRGQQDLGEQTVVFFRGGKGQLEVIFNATPELRKEAVLRLRRRPIETGLTIGSLLSELLEETGGENTVIAEAALKDSQIQLEELPAGDYRLTIERDVRGTPLILGWSDVVIRDQETTTVLFR